MSSQKQTTTSREIAEEWLETAMQWYERSANRGFHAALARLGENDLNGMGVERAPEKAYDYFQRANSTGNYFARARVAWMQLLGFQGIGGFFAGVVEVAKLMYLAGELFFARRNRTWRRIAPRDFWLRTDRQSALMN